MDNFDPKTQKPEEAKIDSHNEHKKLSELLAGINGKHNEDYVKCLMDEFEANEKSKAERESENKRKEEDFIKNQVSQYVVDTVEKLKNLDGNKEISEDEARMIVCLLKTDISEDEKKYITGLIIKSGYENLLPMEPDPNPPKKEQKESKPQEPRTPIRFPWEEWVTPNPHL